MYKCIMKSFLRNSFSRSGSGCVCLPVPGKIRLLMLLTNVCEKGMCFLSVAVSLELWDRDPNKKGRDS